MSADPKTEFKYKDATEAGSEPVRLVAKDVGMKETIGDAFTAQSAADATPDLPLSDDLKPLLSAHVEQASIPQAGFGTQQPVYRLSDHLPGEKPRSSILPDLKQAFNCAYFTAATLASAELVQDFHNNWFLALTLLFGAFAGGAFIYSINQRVHISDFSVTLSRRTRLVIRTIALLIPIPLIVGAGFTRMATYELESAEKAYDAGLFPAALTHLTQAARLNPFNEGTYDAFSRVYFMQSQDVLALQYARQATAMDPDDSYAWTDTARALASLGQDAEATTAAEKAIRLDSQNGQAFSTLAGLYSNAGQYEIALNAAEKHTKLHKEESYAFEQKADILEQLGRSAEAKTARAEAARLTGLESPQILDALNQNQTDAFSSASSADSAATESVAPDTTK